MSLKNRIIVKDIHSDFTKHGVLWVPGNTDSKSYKKMEVIRSAGKKLPEGLSAGDKIYVKPWAGISANIGGEDFKVIDSGAIVTGKHRA